VSRDDDAPQNTMLNVDRERGWCDTPSVWWIAIGVDIGVCTPRAGVPVIQTQHDWIEPLCSKASAVLAALLRAQRRFFLGRERGPSMNRLREAKRRCGGVRCTGSRTAPRRQQIWAAATPPRR
jgi:hypothetical protein